VTTPEIVIGRAGRPAEAMWQSGARVSIESPVTNYDLVTGSSPEFISIRCVNIADSVRVE
jgi:hypothetical protein